VLNGAHTFSADYSRQAKPVERKLFTMTSNNGLPTNRCYCDRPNGSLAHRCFIAATTGDIEGFRHLQQEQERYSACPRCAVAVNDLTWSAESLIYLAAKQGHPAFLDHVLSNGLIDMIDEKQNDGKLPIWASIYHAELLPTFKVLLIHGASLLGRPQSGEFSPIRQLQDFESMIHHKEFVLPLYQWLIKLKKIEDSEQPIVKDSAAVGPNLVLDPVSRVTTCFVVDES